jgi:hypothetical protein
MYYSILKKIHSWDEEQSSHARGEFSDKLLKI